MLTSAVRDAANGAELERELRERFGFEAQTITGEREARLTYLGATGWRGRDAARCWCSTSAAAARSSWSGAGDEVEFSRLDAGRLASASPSATCTAIRRGGTSSRNAPRRCARRSKRPCPPRCARAPAAGIAVAGTPTSFAAIDLRLEPYDRERVQGHRLTLDAMRAHPRRAGLAPLGERRAVTGLHPDRAPTIVAGGVILRRDDARVRPREIEVSERDILEGAAVEAAAGKRPRQKCRVSSAFDARTPNLHELSAKRPLWAFRAAHRPGRVDNAAAGDIALLHGSAFPHRFGRQPNHRRLPPLGPREAPQGTYPCPS